MKQTVYQLELYINEEGSRRAHRVRRAHKKRVAVGKQENYLSEQIIGCCITVHKLLGPGLFESVYEEALAYAGKIKINKYYERSYL